VELTAKVGGVTLDSFFAGIPDSSVNVLPTELFGAFLQIQMAEAPTQITHASDPNRPPPGCPGSAPINLVAPTVKTITAAWDVEVTSRVAIHEGSVRLSGVRNLYIQQVQITNTSTRDVHRRNLTGAR
jgi:hypothetical protein